MQKKRSDSYEKSHNLVNRIYDMLYFLYFFKDNRGYSISEIKDKIRQQIKTLEGIELIIKYFDDKMKKHYKDIEIRCNLTDLITDLNHLKQYIVEWR